MAQERTTNLDLVLPIQADDVLVQDINGNMTKIDTFAGQTNQALSTLNDNIINSIKYIDIEDSNPVNVTNKASGIVTRGNFISVVSQENGIIGIPYVNGSTQYVALKNVSDLTIPTGNHVVRVWYKAIP